MKVFRVNFVGYIEFNPENTRLINTLEKAVVKKQSVYGSETDPNVEWHYLDEGDCTVFMDNINTTFIPEGTTIFPDFGTVYEYQKQWDKDNAPFKGTIRLEPEEDVA
jgi:hypothetical protein